MSRSLAIAVVLLGLACATPPRELAQSDVASVRAQLDTLWTKYSAAVLAADVEVLGRLYTDSAYVVESGLPTVRGNAELRSVVKEVLSGVRFVESSVTPELTEVIGDRAMQFGEYRDVLQPTGQPIQVVRGRFGAVFQRDTSRVWRVSRLIAFPDSTVAQAATPK